MFNSNKTKLKGIWGVRLLQISIIVLFLIGNRTSEERKGKEKKNRFWGNSQGEIRGEGRGRFWEWKTTIRKLP